MKNGIVSDLPVKQVFGWRNAFWARQIYALIQESWPKYIQEDPIARPLWPRLFLQFPDYQFALIRNRRVIGIANSVPLRFDGPLSDLPDEGWHWALRKAFADRKSNLIPNYQCFLSAVVSPATRGSGMSSNILEMMKDIGRRKGFQTGICPVRPNRKADYVDEDMADYIRRKNPDGLPFDPWLRSHVRGGGRMVKVCYRSMIIEAPLRSWELWEKRTFPESGEYKIQGGLSRLKVDCSRSSAAYIEPNVWMSYDYGSMGDP